MPHSIPPSVLKPMQIISDAKVHGGRQGVYTIESDVCGCVMTFAVFVPPQAKEQLCPVLWYLSGLTCTHANVMDKGEYRRMAAEHGLIIVCPDTSPRGDHVPDDDSWQLGKGAGFYLDATEAPWAANFQMESHIIDELQAVIAGHFAADISRQGIFGHSMGGHGALTLALRHPDRFRSCSAFAPIVQPSTADWSIGALTAYLGPDKAAWRGHDATLLIADGARFPEFLVDQGKSDNFLETGLMPWLFEDACREAEIPLAYRLHEGYDHSYNFISTFMDDHLAWHASRLA